MYCKCTVSVNQQITVNKPEKPRSGCCLSIFFFLLLLSFFFHVLYCTVQATTVHAHLQSATHTTSIIRKRIYLLPSSSPFFYPFTHSSRISTRASTLSARAYILQYSYSTVQYLFTKPPPHARARRISCLGTSPTMVLYCSICISGVSLSLSQLTTCINVLIKGKKGGHGGSISRAVYCTYCSISAVQYRGRTWGSRVKSRLPAT